MRHIEQARAVARGVVLGAHRRVPHRHVVSGEGHHLRAEFFVQRVQRGRLERRIGGFFPGEDGQRLANWPGEARATTADEICLARRVARAARRPVRVRLVRGEGAHVRHFSQQADADRPRHFGEDVAVVEASKAIRQRAQPGRHPFSVVVYVEVIGVIVELVQHPARQRRAVGPQRPGGLGIARGQGAHIAGERRVQEIRHMRAVDVERAPAILRLPVLRQHVEMLGGGFRFLRVGGQIGHRVVNARLSHQPVHGLPRRHERVEVHFGAPLHLAAAAQVAERRAGEQHIGHDIGQALRLRLAEAALGEPGRAQAEARRPERRFVAGDGVAIEHDPGQVEDARGHVAAERRAIGAAHRLAVHQQQVRARPAVRDAQPARRQPFRQAHGVGDDLALQGAELLGRGQLESDRHAGDGVDVRAALLAGEDGAIQLAPDLGVGGDQHGAARPGHRLVRGEADHVGMADRRREDARRRQPGDVRDVGQQVGAHFVGDGAEGRPVRRVGVRGEAGDNDLGVVLAGQVTNLVVVEQLGLRVYAVADHVVDAPAAVDRAAVRQVTAVQQVHAHQRVARLDQRAVDGAVGRRAAQRLHVDPQIVRANRVGGE